MIFDVHSRTIVLVGDHLPSCHLSVLPICGVRNGQDVGKRQWSRASPQRGDARSQRTTREVGHVFGRGQALTRKDLVRAEFGESLGHVRMAATHAASGVGASVGPWAGAVRDSARERMGSTGGRLVTVREYTAPSAARISRAASRSWDTTIAIVTPLAYAVREGSVRATGLPETLRRKDMSNEASSGHRKSTVA